MFSPTTPPWINRIPCPLLLVALDDGRLLFANRRAGTLLGGNAEPGAQASAVFADAGEYGRMLQALRGTGRIDHAMISLHGGAGRRLDFRCEAERAEFEGLPCGIITLHPVAEHRPARTAIAPDSGLWRAAFEAAGVGIILLDKDWGFVDANPCWEALFGYTAGELRLPHASPGIRAEDLCGPGFDLGALLRGEIDRYRTERCYVHKDGHPFWGDLSLGVLRDGTGTPAFVVGCLLDVTGHKRTTEQLSEHNERLAQQLFENRKLHEKLSELAVRDPLTGLFNRRYMEETLERELARSARDHGPLSLVIMDIDHFKRLNDTHGHQAGDQVLKVLANLLRTHMRRGDVTCRYGGEEFVAILPGAPSATAAARADSWRRAFEALRLDYEGQPIRSTLSVGIAEFPRHGSTGEELLFQADSALYLAKRSGRNRVSLPG